MNAKHLIGRTRDGQPLSRPEIDFLVRGAVSGEVPDYQLTAWMMAVFHRGLTPGETADLTLSMRDSGERVDIPASPYLPADKHSTGGVGDKISFLVAPLVAAAGVSVPMISGRSLGHTGGTLDKLESIPGLRTDFAPGEFARLVQQVGFCIAGQSSRLAPADRILYALRDAASIVESVPLITASILSKKAAAGVRALALDVKFGGGAFMSGIAEARRLAQSLVDTALLLDIHARAHLTCMDWVLGRTAGGSVEILECIRALRGEGTDPDLRALTLTLGSSMLMLSGAAASEPEARALLEAVWQSGAGYEKFARMVVAQGGDGTVLEHTERLPSARSVLEVGAPADGYFRGIEARPAGHWISEAGGGRQRAGQAVDARIGLEVLLPRGSRVAAGEPVLRLHLADGDSPKELRETAASWIGLSARAEPESPLVAEVVNPLS